MTNAVTSRAPTQARSSLTTTYLPATLLAAATFVNVRAAFEAERVGVGLYRSMSSVTWAMLLVLVLIRRPSLQKTRTPRSIAAALLAVAAPVAISTAGTSPSDSRLYVATVVMLVGQVVTLVSFVALGRCFGVLADARGLVVRGPYRLVRHPVYSSEIVTMFGMALGARALVIAFTAWAVTVAAQAARSTFEEQALGSAFPAHASYKTQVRWRLLPGVF